MERTAIESKLSKLKSELADVRGTKTEVYSRIVGYYRSVKNWNAGKRAEYGTRRMYSIPSAVNSGSAEGGVQTERARPASAPALTHKSAETRPAALFDTLAAPKGKPNDYMLFVRSSCPNCPPVKSFLAQSGLPGHIVDVDTEDGLSLARTHNVLASPTALVRSHDGSEVYRAYTVTELRAFLAPVGAAPVGAAPVGASPVSAAPAGQTVSV